MKVTNQSSGFFHSCPPGASGLSLPSQSFAFTSAQSVESTVPPLVWKLLIMALLFSSSPFWQICLNSTEPASSPYSSQWSSMSPSISLLNLSQLCLILALDGQLSSFFWMPSGMPSPSLLRKVHVSVLTFFSITTSMLFSLRQKLDLTRLILLKRTRSSLQVPPLLGSGNCTKTRSSVNLMVRSSFFSTEQGISMPTLVGV